MAFDFKQKLPTPQEIRELYPVPAHVAQIKKERDEEIRKIFTGESDRFIAIIGPCSADNEESVCDYVRRLVRVQEKIKDKVLIIPRIYTNKPRTTGDGYKGIMHQPDPEKKPDPLAGIIALRHMHIRAIEETGMTAADEMLYPENLPYVEDFLSYIAIGARSVEDQQHRLTVSGFDIPAGMKNPTSGDLSVMLNSVHAAQGHHTFIYRGWEVESTGNPLAHAILRGYQTTYGKTVSNYHYEDLAGLYERYAKSGLENPAVLIDTNHANSGKHYEEQIRISRDVLGSMRQNADIRRLCKGLMIESYLVDGCQKTDGEVFGQSITDPCLGWEKTERLIYEIADML